MNKPREVSCAAKLPEAVVVGEEAVVAAEAEAALRRPTRPYILGTKAVAPARSG
jgi:hypothetical protein